MWIKIILIFLIFMPKCYAGIQLFLSDQATTSQVPEFPDKDDAIFYGLIHSDDPGVANKLNARIYELEAKMKRLVFPKLEGEDKAQYEDRLKEMKELFLQAGLVKQALFTATGIDDAMLSKQERVERYEKEHNMKFEVPVGASMYAGSEPCIENSH